MKVVTHSGTFHADDVFAFAILREALGAFDFVRTRDMAEIEAADLVFDVGGSTMSRGAATTTTCATFRAGRTGRPIAPSA